MESLRLRSERASRLWWPVESARFSQYPEQPDRDRCPIPSPALADNTTLRVNLHVDYDPGRFDRRHRAAVLHRRARREDWGKRDLRFRRRSHFLFAQCPILRRCEELVALRLLFFPSVGWTGVGNIGFGVAWCGELASAIAPQFASWAERATRHENRRPLQPASL